MQENLLERMCEAYWGDLWARYPDQMKDRIRASMTRSLDLAVSACREAYEAHDRTGRDWVAGSLWDGLNREGAARVAKLIDQTTRERN